MLGFWIHRARHSGLWQVKSGHPGKGKWQLSQDNFAPDFLPVTSLKGKEIDQRWRYFESGCGNSSDNDNGDHSNNDDDDDDDDAVVQAVTILVAMVSKKKLGG